MQVRGLLSASSKAYDCRVIWHFAPAPSSIEHALWEMCSFFIHKFIKSFLPFCISKRAIFLCFVAVKVYEVLEVVAHRHKEPLHEHLQFPRGKSSWAANTVVMRRVGKSIFTQRQRRGGLPIATLRQSTCRYVFPQSQRSRAINSDGIVFKYLRLHKKRLIAACDAEVVFCAFN